MIHAINNYHKLYKNMHLISKLNFSKTDYFSLLLAILPISFIAGNMIININVILIIISALVIFKDKLFKINFYFLDKLLIAFFYLYFSPEFITILLYTLTTETFQIGEDDLGLL